MLSRIKEIRYDYVSSGWIGMSLWESLGQQFVVAESLSFEERQQLTRLGWLSLSGAGHWWIGLAGRCFGIFLASGGSVTRSNGGDCVVIVVCHSLLEG